MQELISVIVPVYNTAAYLRDGIQSVLAQSWTRFELLLVDDGSGDESVSICRDFCEKDRRIRLLQQAHEGVSAARNRALREAKGDYLFFLDSDDAIHPRLLEALLQLAKEHDAAIAQADGRRVCSKELQALLKASDSHQEYSGLYMKNWQALEQICRSAPAFILFLAIGGKLVRRDAALPFLFDEEMVSGEDTKFVYQLFASGTDAVILRQKWYYYRIHADNASFRHSLTAYRNIYECYKYICEQEKKSGRPKNAALCSCRLIYTLLEWYRLSGEEGAADLTEYLKGLAAAERESWRFSLLSFPCKVQFFLMMDWYPLYRCLFPLLLLRRKWAERRQKRK